MSKKVLVMLTAIFALTVGYVFAEEMKAEEPKADTAVIPAAPVAPVVQAEVKAAVQVNNTICPISGEAIKEGEGVMANLSC